MKLFITVLVLVYFGNLAHASSYTWNYSVGGDTRCYEHGDDGQVVNDGQPVGDSLCEKVSPTLLVWAQSQGGKTRCYHETIDGKALNKGQPVSEALCEKALPSKFHKNEFGKCFQYTDDGRILNQGNPVSVDLCR